MSYAEFVLKNEKEKLTDTLNKLKLLNINVAESGYRVLQNSLKDVENAIGTLEAMKRPAKGVKIHLDWEDYKDLVTEGAQ